MVCSLRILKSAISPSVGFNLAKALVLRLELVITARNMGLQRHVQIWPCKRQVVQILLNLHSSPDAADIFVCFQDARRQHMWIAG